MITFNIHCQSLCQVYAILYKVYVLTREPSESVYASACELSQDIMHKLYNDSWVNYAFSFL